MLANSPAHTQVAHIPQKGLSRFRMVLRGGKTPGLGDVMEQCRGPDQFAVETLPGCIEAFHQEGGDVIHPQGVGGNMVHHLHLAHQAEALLFRRYSHVDLNSPTVEKPTLPPGVTVGFSVLGTAFLFRLFYLLG